MSTFERLVLLVVAAVVLGVGIQSPTGLTGKDEYLLGLRVPLEMMQGDHWWVPFIDGEPRLKKPPFLYWLGRASFEIFGPSLVAARAITVAFGLLLLACTAYLGRRLTGNGRTAVLAALILLGMSGMASESRRFMLDIPVAAMSLAAFCTYRAWLDRPRFPLLLATGLLLAGALLTKGPIAPVVFGSGVLALWLTDPTTRGSLTSAWREHVALGLMAVLPAAFWYLDVREHYAPQLARAAADELEARQIGLSPDALLGLLSLALPWSFVALHALWRDRRRAETRFLTIWLLGTLLPFLFIRAFERYLIGSLPVLALVIAVSINGSTVPAWTRRVGGMLAAVPALILAMLLWRWQLGDELILLTATVLFVVVWWQRTSSPVRLAVSAAGLWAIGWGVAFPSLGVNAIPAELTALTHDRAVILFAGPQPALLPILEQRPLRQTSQLTVPLLPGTMISVRAEDRKALDAQLAATGITTVDRYTYQALTSAGSGIRFAREGATREDWLQSWEQRAPTPLMSTIQLVEVQP